MNIFDILKDIIYIKSGSLYDEPDFSKSFQPFMIARYLSMRNDYLKYALFVNRYNNVLSNKQIYSFLIKNIPQNKNYFIKYISKPKKKNKEDINEDE